MNDNSRTIVFTLSALVAFAANSILCRKALGAAAIDAASFTAVRLISGAVVLWVLIRLVKNREASNQRGGTWLSASMLFFMLLHSLSRTSSSARVPERSFSFAPSN